MEKISLAKSCFLLNFKMYKRASNTKATNEFIWKKKSLIRTFIHGHCEVLNMKLNIWLDIPSKYMEDFYDIVCINIVGLFSERLTKISCQDFFLWFLAFL